MPSALVIDNPSSLRDEMVRAIEGAGIHAHVTDRPDEGLAWAGRRHPEFVLIDAALAGAGSLAAVQRLRADPRCRSARVLLLAANPRRDEILRAASLGVSAVILKNAEAPRQLLAKLAAQQTRHAPGSCAGARPASAASTPPAPVPSSGQPAPGPSGAAPACAPGVASSVPSAARRPSLDEATAELAASGRLIGKDKLLASIDEQSQLGALSPVVELVLSMTAGESASLEDISRAIKQDHSIAIRVLKLANSAAYSRGDVVDTVPKAVSRIGISQIRSVVLSINVVDSFGAAPLCGRIRCAWFWEHSIACALFASRLARAAGLPPAEADVLFTAGLLHDVGRMILARAVPELYTHVLETAERLAVPVERAEHQFLGLSHAEVTDRIMRAWRFPADLAGPIALHHASLTEIRQANPRVIRPTATLALADRLAHAMLLGSSGNEAVYAMNDLIDFLQIRDEALADIEKAVPEQTAEMKLGLLSHATATIDETVRGACTASLPKGRVLFVGQGRPDPAHRHLAETLSTDPAAPPTLVLASIDRRKDLEALCTRIDALEAEAGGANLPVLALSPTGRLDLPTQRRRVLAPASGAFSRYVEAVNSLLAPL